MTILCLSEVSAIDLQVFAEIAAAGRAASASAATLDVAAAVNRPGPTGTAAGALPALAPANEAQA
jgi:hypothetical protein